MVTAADEGCLVLGGCLIGSGQRRVCVDCGFRWGDLGFDAEPVLAGFVEAAHLDLYELMDQLDDRFTPRRPERFVGRAALDSERDQLFEDLDVGQGEMQLVLGDPGLVAVTLRLDGAVEVDEYSLTWNGHATPVAQRLGEPLLLVPTAYLEDPVERTLMLVRLIRDSGRRRSAKFSRCGSCGFRVPPEERYDSTICSSCAEASGLVVH